MAYLNLTQSPGDVNVSSQFDGGGFHPGMLQDILKWKMGMAEEMQRAQLERMRMEMRLAQQQARASQQGGSSAPSRVSAPTPSKGGRQFDPRRELWAAANTPSGMGADFDKMRRTQALQLMLGGGGGSASISNSPEQAAKAALAATEEPRRGVNEGMNTPERSKGGGPGIGKMGTMTSSSPMPSRYVPGDVEVPTYYVGPGSGRETGGGIPEDGWYYLHEKEQVVPAPKTLKSMLMGELQGSGSPEKGYAKGTPGAQENLFELLYGLMSRPSSPEQEESNLEAAFATEPGLRRPQSFEDEMGLPEPPGMPAPTDTIVRESQEARQMVADPDVHPQQALDQMAAERERLGSGRSMPTSRPGERGIEGLSVTESPISERKGTSFKGETLYNRPETSQRTVKNYTLDQSPRGPEEAATREMEEMTRQLEKEQSDIQRLYDAANSHAQYAGNLLEYASKIQGTPAYENMRQMASDRLALAQEIERVASVRQKQLDTRQGVMGEQQAKVAAAQIEAGGRVGAAKAGAEGRQAMAGQSREEALMNNIRQLVTSYAGIEGGDPDTQAQMVQDMLSLFLSIGGLRQGMAGTE